MARERVAAAILLVQGSGPDTRIYLVERARQLRFFGGYHALPGGVLDPDETGDTGDTGNTGDTGDTSDTSDTSDTEDLRRCALRELFEETGVLLDGGMARLPTGERQDLRRKLLARDHDNRDRGKDASGPDPWRRLLASADGDASLSELARIKTPPFAPVRYDTVFFLARLPEGQEPEILEGELVGGGFHRPQDLLASWRRGELLIVPPVLILLELFAAAGGDLEAFQDATRKTVAGYHQGQLHRVHFSPGILLASLRTPTLPPATTTNCYLVGSKRLQIVDPGTPYEDELSRLYQLLDELRAEGCTLENILLTHHHQDHVGGVHPLSKRYDLPVRGHPLTLERLEPGFRAGKPIREGEHIDLGRAPDGSSGWHLEAIFTPGHDRGHYCFRESRYDAVIVGDMLSTVSTIVIDPPEGHLQTYMDSLQRLLDTPMTTLYPAHGPAVPDGHDLIRKYIRHRNQRQHSLATALATGPATPDELLPRVYWDVPRRLHPIAARSLLAGLHKLKEDGLAENKGDIWHMV